VAATSVERIHIAKRRANTSIRSLRSISIKNTGKRIKRDEDEDEDEDEDTNTEVDPNTEVVDQNTGVVVMVVVVASITNIMVTNIIVVEGVVEGVDGAIDADVKEL